MAKKKTNSPRLPSKDDLFAVINSGLRSYEVCGEYRKLRVAENAAEAALRKFEKTNKTYLKLVVACETASKRREQFRTSFNDEVRSARNAIRMRGVTSETVARVEALRKKYE